MQFIHTLLLALFAAMVIMHSDAAAANPGGSFWHFFPTIKNDLWLLDHMIVGAFLLDVKLSIGSLQSTPARASN